MIYVDNAATTYPKPEEVYNEIFNCMRNYAANPGRSTHSMALKSASKVMEVRNILSSFFNVKNPFNIVFTNNATESLNIGIKGVLNKGDHVITTVIEHNSVLRPLSQLKKIGVEVTLLDVDKYGQVNIENLKNNIKNNTKLIIINHVSNVLGTIQNINLIGSIAKNKEILFMVDASQSAGIVDVDVERDNIDLLAFPGHKGLLGPQGTGGLFIREGIMLSTFKEGGTGSNSNSVEQPEFLPDRFESGTLNVPGIVGLGEGIKFIQRTGLETIKKHEKELTEYLLKELKKMSYVKIYGHDSYENRCGVVSINLDSIDSSQVGYKLNKKDIAVRTGYHCAALIHPVIGTNNHGTVRISLGYYNTFEHVETIIKTLKDIYENR